MLSVWQKKKCPNNKKEIYNDTRDRLFGLVKFMKKPPQIVDNAMAKGKKTNRKTMAFKTLHRKLTIEQYKHH